MLLDQSLFIQARGVLKKQLHRRTFAAAACCDVAGVTPITVPGVDRSAMPSRSASARLRRRIVPFQATGKAICWWGLADLTLPLWSNANRAF